MYIIIHRGYILLFDLKIRVNFLLRYINRTEYIPYDLDPTGVNPLNKIKGEKNYFSEFLKPNIRRTQLKTLYMNYLVKAENFLEVELFL